MEQTPFLEADSRSASQPLVRTLRQKSPYGILPLSFFKINFNIVFPSTTRLPQVLSSVPLYVFPDFPVRRKHVSQIEILVSEIRVSHTCAYEDVCVLGC